MLSARFLASLLALAAAVPLAATPALAADDGKVPYWASLHADTANLRVGPDDTFKIDWVYHRLGLPLKVLRREGPWRLVQDPDGATGWMRDLLLSRTRAAIVRSEALVEMHADANGGGAMLWRVEPGVIGLLGDCKEGFCAFDADGHKGFVREEALWGTGEP